MILLAIFYGTSDKEKDVVKYLMYFGEYLEKKKARNNINNRLWTNEDSLTHGLYWWFFFSTIYFLQRNSCSYKHGITIIRLQ